MKKKIIWLVLAFLLGGMCGYAFRNYRAKRQIADTEMIFVSAEAVVKMAHLILLEKSGKEALERKMMASLRNDFGMLDMIINEYPQTSQWQETQQDYERIKRFITDKQGYPPTTGWQELSNYIDSEVGENEENE